MSKILAISSGGGHWEQLTIISESFGPHDVIFANTIPGLAEKSAITGAHIIRDCNRDRPVAIILSFIDVLRLVMREKPDIIITTGAAPGLLALVVGKMSGKRTIWIDSVANSEKLSMSGRLAGALADLHVTQWEHLAGKGRTRYLGSVL
uniref:Oligosaccharide biosynthesis protein Alg14 like protein n=1 Tax=Mycobacterium sp. (strain JLS) TaxID=164757 RepID=A0A5Q5CC75_MYCSJ